MEPELSLVGVAELVLKERGLAAALEDAPGARVPALDLTGPAALRPFVVKGLVDAGRTVLVVAATAREAEDLVESLGCVMNPDLIASYPAWETLPHERLSPRSDTVGSAPGRAPPVGPPRPGRQQRAAQGGRGPCPLGAAAPGAGPGRPRAGRAHGGQRGRARGRRAPPGRCGLPPGGPGGASRRVRRPRRHRGRLPADRGAPAPRGVLGRRGRGDPLVLGRRPAHLGEDRPALGPALPRAAAHRRGAGPGPRARRAAPRAARDHREARRGSRGRGHGVPGPGPGRRRWSCSST